MTQTANPVTLLASPLGEEGHEVAKGWTVVILIMILDVDVTAEGSIIKLIARRAIPPPFEPSEPYEPSEPSHRRCVQWHSRIGGGERSEPITRVLNMLYDIESQSRNADLISIAHRAIHHPRPEGPLPPERSEHNPSTQPAASAAPLFFKICGEAATTTLGAKGPVKLKNPLAHRAGQS